MISDKEYKEISDRIYRIDPKHPKYNSNLKKGAITEFNNIKYQILETKNEPKNGMQAMAVAPIVNGKADTSQVVIAYAGTNQSDKIY